MEIVPKLQAEVLLIWNCMWLCLFDTLTLCRSDQFCQNKVDRISGWWYGIACGFSYLTGQHTKTQVQAKPDLCGNRICYYWGGQRGNTGANWKEAHMVLLPK